MKQRKFYRTRITVEVLSENILSSDMSLADIDYAITDGDCSGEVTWGDPEELDADQMAAALIAQNSDPGFFSLDEDEEDDEDGD